MFKSPPPVYNFTDWKSPVRQRTLAELGLPWKYALHPSRWPMLEAGELIVSPDSFPYTDTITGEGYTVETLWRNTPGFRETFESPIALLWALTRP